MNSWIADFFQCGHSLEYIHDMSYGDYLSIVSAIITTRGSKKKGSRNLSPVQKSALTRAKELNKK